MAIHAYEVHPCPRPYWSGKIQISCVCFGVTPCIAAEPASHIRLIDALRKFVGRSTKSTRTIATSNPASKKDAALIGTFSKPYTPRALKPTRTSPRRKTA